MRRLPLLLLLLLPACADGVDLTSSDVPRIEFLNSAARTLAEPAMRDLADRAADLRDALDALASSPGADALADAQAAWREARGAWNRSEPFHLEEIEARRYFARMNANPVDPDEIEEEVAGSTPLTPSYIETLGSRHRGFFALEYLLFDGPDGDDDVLMSLTVDAGANRRREYATALGANLAALAAEMHGVWDPGAGDLRGDFAEAGLRNGRFDDSADAVNAFVNRVIMLAEELADVSLGKPLGKPKNGVPQPPGVAAERSRNSRREALELARGLAAAYRGGNGGLGLRHIVLTTAPELDPAIDEAFAHVLADIETIPETLLDTSRNVPALVETAFASAKELRRRLVVDLVAALSTTLLFSPDDGD